MKKNQGFSLVELIVVIAIMAILVGVLAPAYLRYVEKSRKSTDVSSITDIMGAAEKVAIDPELPVTSANTFIIATDSTDPSLVTVSIGGTDTGSKIVTAFKDVANMNNDYTLKSKTFSTGGGTLTGYVTADGSVYWIGSGIFAKTGTDTMGDYSSDFSKKLS